MFLCTNQLQRNIVGGLTFLIENKLFHAKIIMNFQNELHMHIELDLSANEIIHFSGGVSLLALLRFSYQSSSVVHALNG